MELPENVLSKIREISSKYQLPEEEILKDYLDLYNSEFVQTDPQFKDETDKHDFCTRAIYVKYASTPPTQEVEIIPIGIRSPKRSKSDNMWRSQIYALVRKSKELSKATIFLTGNSAFEVNNIKPFLLYKLRLATWSADRYSFTNLTKITEPKMLSTNPIEILKHFLSIREVKIADTPIALSNLRDGKYVDEWDLRLIRGFVLNYGMGGDDESGKWAYYMIADETASSEERFTSTGTIIPNRLIVWLPQNFLKYDIGSELYFIGTITLTDKKEPRMNAISVLPIHAKILMRDDLNE